MQKSISLLLCLGITFSCLAQELKPTETEALLRFYITGSDDFEPTKILLTGVNSKKNYTVTCGFTGEGAILVPNGETYSINLVNMPDFNRVEVPKQAYVEMDIEIDLSPGEGPESSSNLHLLVLNEENVPLQEEVTLVSQKTGRKYQGMTDANGLLKLSIPVNDTYRISFKGAPDYDEFFMDNDPSLILEYTCTFEGSLPGKLYPTLDNALFTIEFKDLEDEPLEGEEITVKGAKSGQRYIGTTDKNGLVQLLVPIGDTYSFHLKHMTYNEKYAFDPKPGLKQANIYLKNLSSKDWEVRTKEKLRRIAIRDSLFALRQAQNQAGIYDENLISRIWKERIEEKALKAREGLKSDPKFFEKTKQVINTVFYRIGSRWKSKVIVMDLTCSMDPYAEEVLVWTSLKIITDENMQFLFFNDGDGKPNEMKKIGQTGGFHHTDKLVMDTLIVKMLETKRTGCSGDQPENDLEALLEGVRYRAHNDELILIADNYSDVRDIELLEKLNVPVRIILCGVDHEINEQYLDIAWKTEGSVHTIEEDIWNLSHIAEGKKLVVGGHEYLFSKGNFIFVK